MKTKKGMGNLSWIAVLMVTLTMAVTFGCSDDKGSKDSEDKTPGVLKPGPLPTPTVPLPTEGGGAVSAPPATPPATAPVLAGAPAVLPAEVAVAAAPEVEEKEAVVEDQTVTECPVVPVAVAGTGPEEKTATPKEKGKEREQFPEHEIFNYLTADVDSFVRCDVGKLVVSTLVRQLNDRTDDFKTLHEESDNFLDFFCARHESFGDVLIGLKGIDTSTNGDDKSVVLAQFREPLNAECDTLKAVMEGQDANFREPLSGQAIKAIAMPAEAGEAGTRFKITRQDDPEAVLMFGYLPADLKYLFLVPTHSEEEARERALEMLDTTISVSRDEESSIKTTPLYDFYQNLRSTAMCDGVGKFQEILPEYLRLYDSPYIAFKMDSLRARSAREGTRYGLMKVSAALYSDETSGSWSWNFSADIKSEVVERFFAREFASASSPSQPVDLGGRGPGGVQVRPSAGEIAEIQKKIADVEKALKYVRELSSLTVTWTNINTLPAWLGKEITAQFENLPAIKKSDLIPWLGAKLTELKNKLEGLVGKYPPEPTKPVRPAGKSPTDGVKVIEGTKLDLDGFKEIKVPAKK